MEMVRVHQRQSEFTVAATQLVLAGWICDAPSVALEMQMSDSKSPKDNGGPLVKTGPTRGENRTRTKDGRWREKRSDAGKPRESKSGKSEKKGCFLTTAACENRGLPDDCRELQTLRAFRDDVLLTSSSGRRIVEEYYRVAPSLVPLLDDSETAERVWCGIALTVSHIEAGRQRDAISTYRGVVTNLLLTPAKSTR